MILTIPEITVPVSLKDAYNMNAVVLAFIGDAVHTLAVRAELALTHTSKTDKLHAMTSKRVKAAAQAELLEFIKDEFNETETEIYMRGRNAHTATVAKNATLADYKKATGLEAVIGYLYLTGQTGRIKELLEKTAEL